MNVNLRGGSLWLSRGALLLFVASSALRFDSHSDGLYFALVLLYVPVGAFVAWIQFLFEGFDSRTLLWASLMTLVTLLNAFFFLVGPPRRGVLEERTGLISLLLGLAIVAVVVLFEAAAYWPNRSGTVGLDRFVRFDVSQLRGKSFCTIVELFFHKCCLS